MPDVRRVTITLARPSGPDDLGAVEHGYFVLEGETVTLTSEGGEKLRRTTMGRRGEAPTWSRKLQPGESAERAARDLLFAKFNAGRRNSDFNRPLRYPSKGII
jgi:hypothetical protein